MAALSVNVKRFIVHSLACFETPTEVCKLVKEEFGIDLIRQNVARYDPTKSQGKDLSKQLTEYFHECRERFRTDIDNIPIANQTFRLKSLAAMHAKACEKGNMPMASQLLEQAAKEVGGAYTNTRKVQGGEPGTPPVTIAAVVASAADLPADDVAKLYKTLMG